MSWQPGLWERAVLWLQEHKTLIADTLMVLGAFTAGWLFTDLCLYLWRSLNYMQAFGLPTNFIYWWCSAGGWQLFSVFVISQVYFILFYYCIGELLDDDSDYMDEHTLERLEADES